MMILTLYALFGADVNVIAGDASTDDYVAALVACMLVFLAELCLLSRFKPLYAWGVYFGSTSSPRSLLGDIPWIAQQVLPSSAAAARAAARAARARGPRGSSASSVWSGSRARTAWATASPGATCVRRGARASLSEVQRGGAGPPQDGPKADRAARSSGGPR